MPDASALVAPGARRRLGGELEARTDRHVHAENGVLPVLAHVGPADLLEARLVGPWWMERRTSSESARPRDLRRVRSSGRGPPAPSSPGARPCLTRQEGVHLRRAEHAPVGERPPRKSSVPDPAHGGSGAGHGEHERGQREQRREGIEASWGAACSGGGQAYDRQEPRSIPSASRQHRWFGCPGGVRGEYTEVSHASHPKLMPDACGSTPRRRRRRSSMSPSSPTRRSSRSTRYGDTGRARRASVMTVAFRLGDFDLVALNGGPQFKIQRGDLPGQSRWRPRKRSTGTGRR